MKRPVGSAPSRDHRVMGHRRLIVVTLLLALVGPAACGRHPPTAQTSANPNVVDFTGVRDIRLGASLSQLAAAGRVLTPESACRPVAADLPAAGPVFDGDTLVLIWAEPPLHTPAGVMVGTPVAAVRRAYPSAEALVPPAGSTTYPGLLVGDGSGHAYLMLHDGDRVQKLIVGLESYARRLFATGFGSC